MPSREALGRFSTIDGLRGYLAFFVFLHHSCIWYPYLHSNKWEAPPSNLFIHFGESSVSVFFMITGFLFFSKLFDAKDKPINWKKLYISRIFRIAPLYFFTITVMFAIVAFLSEGKVNEPLLDIRHEVWRWMQFTAFGAPDINGVKNTSIIVASVTWSIAYEWVFYLLLPFAAVLFGIRPSIKVLLIGLTGFGISISMHAEPKFLGIFLAGFTAAALVRSDKFCQIAKHKTSSALCILCVAIAVCIFDSAYHLVPIALLTIAFSIIAGGNNLFGMLSKHTSIALGNLSYSIYLLHGIILFTALKLVLNPNQLQRLSLAEYWLLIAALTPILIVCSTLSFHFIERPAMKFGTNLSKKTKNEIPESL